MTLQQIVKNAGHSATSARECEELHFPLILLLHKPIVT